MKFLLLVIALIVQSVLVFSQDDYCFGKDTDRLQTRHFTSKTAYQIIKGTNMDKHYLVPGCEPQKVWIFHRHGTRLPSKNTIQKAERLKQLQEEIIKNYQVRRTKPATNALCQEDLLALMMWRWNASITPDQENYLTSQGYDDLRGTAKLYQKYYPDVLPREYNSTHYLFLHTDTQRTTESFKAFTEGLFGSGSIAKPQDIPTQDILLRPYDYCEAWNSQDYSGPESENYKYKHSSLWNRTIADISVRLGFLYTLDSSDVELMYDMCRYEQAWQVDRTSVWCAAFTSDQVTVFEYEDDMKYFYKSGYGYEDNSRLNCHAVQDMLIHFKSTSAPNAIAYFGHSTGVQTLITALGINKDNIKLNATNYNQLNNRHWKTSNIDPFAANFLAVKYHCASESTEKDKIMFFLNQYAVDLDWCDVGLCNWSDVMKNYQEIYEADCGSYYCRSGSSGLFGSLLVILSAFIYLIQ